MLPKKLPAGIRFRQLSNRDRSVLGLPPLPDEVRSLLHPTDEEVEQAIRSVPKHYSATCYLIYNSAVATTAAPVKQPTAAAAIRTMMQLKLGAASKARIIEWGCSFDGSAAATPGQVELFECTVAATMSTAYVNGDIQLFNDAGGVAQGTVANSPIDVTSTATSGFATAAVTEGTVTAYRNFDLQMLPPTAPYVKQWPLGREPDWKSGNFLRCRMTFVTAVNAYIYVVFES